MFPGSFAKGELFQFNPETNDKRNSGTFASMAGLERALASGDPAAVDAAVDRILMGHALIASFGGIPLVYMGDEIALLNDYGYADDPDLAHDSRWLHRPRDGLGPRRRRRGRRSGPRAGCSPACAASSPGARRRRNCTPPIPTVIADTGQSGLFAFVRQAPTGALVCIYNFTEFWATLRHEWALSQGARAVPRRAVGRGRRARRGPDPAAALRPAVAALNALRVASAPGRRRPRRGACPNRRQGLG